MKRMRSYLSKLFQIASYRKFWLTTLGRTGRQYIWLVRTSLEFDPNKPNLLIVGGTHGEETAGPYAILRFLENAPECYFKKANLSFLPCVSPVAFNRGTRYARNGEKTNCGYCHPENGDILSVEGKILMNNIDFIKEMTRNGFMSLHEDVTVDKFYIYTFGNSRKPGALSIAMRDEELKYFEPLPDGEKVNEENDPDAVVTNGIVYNLHDGSIEDLLFHEDILNIIVTETPGLNIGLEKRVEAGAALIKKFIDLTVRK